MSDRSHDPFTGQPLRPDHRQGIPPDKFGAFFVPLAEDKRHAVMMLLFPPEALRDQPYEVVEQAIFSHGTNMLRTIAQEIHQSYTSEPPSLAGAENALGALQRFVDSQRRKSRG